MMQTDAVHTRLLLSFPLHLFTIVYMRFHFVHPFAWVDAVDPIFCSVNDARTRQQTSNYVFNFL